MSKKEIKQKHFSTIIIYLQKETKMNDNPWKVNSIQEFAFLNCPGSVITVIEFHSETGEI